MSNQTPIRLLLIGSRGPSMNAVRAALEAQNVGCGFSISETNNPAKLTALAHAKNAQIVVMVRPEIRELMCDFLALNDGRIPVIVVGGGGKKPSAQELKSARVDGYLAVREVHRLPFVVNELLGRDQDEMGEAVSDGIFKADALRESQKLISIGRLSAEIAHEINNPLESVGNLLYLAQCEANLPERTAEYLRGAERELARVVQISKQTLSFYRESSQPMKIHMAELMDEVVSLYGRRLMQKKIRIIREYSAEEPVTALPGEIRQVLSNLVTNAIEASAPGGKLRLRIRNGQQWQGNARLEGLRISVADNGSGIPEAARKRLGELFFTTKGQSGTGLGLWVTKAIVSRYGGSMQLKSNTGEHHGTVFSIFLPIDHRPQQRSLQEAQSARRGNVTEISKHPSHHDNQAAGSSGVRHQNSQHAHAQVGYTQKRNG